MLWEKSIVSHFYLASIFQNVLAFATPVAALCCCLLKTLKGFTILPANVPPVNIPSAKLQFLHNNNFFFFACCPSQLTNSPQLIKKPAEKGSCSLIQNNILLNPPQKCATFTCPKHSNQNKNTGTGYLIN